MSKDKGNKNSKPSKPKIMPRPKPNPPEIKPDTTTGTDPDKIR